MLLATRGRTKLPFVSWVDSGLLSARQPSPEPPQRQLGVPDSAPGHVSLKDQGSKAERPTYQGPGGGVGRLVPSMSLGLCGKSVRVPSPARYSVRTPKELWELQSRVRVRAQGSVGVAVPRQSACSGLCGSCSPMSVRAHGPSGSCSPTSACSGHCGSSSPTSVCVPMGSLEVVVPHQCVPMGSLEVVVPRRAT